MHLNLKPLSVNEARKGKRYKSDAYSRYERLCFAQLPNMDVYKGPLAVCYEFGLSNSQSDYDNPVKPFQDILQKRYGFNDSMIYLAIVEKKKVEKWKEYIDFFIMPYADIAPRIEKALDFTL